MKKHIICLQGQGDIDVALCTPEQFTWIESDPLVRGRSSWTETDPTRNVAVEVTIGSYDNDRALAVVTGQEVLFTSFGAAAEYAKSKAERLPKKSITGVSIKVAQRNNPAIIHTSQQGAHNALLQTHPGLPKR